MIPMPQDAAEWEQVLLLLWQYLTPLSLTLAVIILVVRITHLGNWDRRMSRATFVLVLSYAVIIDRIFLRNIGVIDSPRAISPEPFWAAFYVITTAYFFYALVVEHVLPIALRGILRLIGWLRRDPYDAELWLTPAERNDKDDAEPI